MIHGLNMFFGSIILMVILYSIGRRIWAFFYNAWALGHALHGLHQRTRRPAAPEVNDNYCTCPYDGSPSIQRCPLHMAVRP